MKVFNPHTKKLQRLQEMGGKYGITGRGHYTRVSIHDDFTLFPHIDNLYQFILIYPNDKDINVTLDTAKVKHGDRFIIKNDSGGNTDYALVIKQGAATIDKLYAQVIKEFIYTDDGPTGNPGWTGASLGTCPDDNYQGIGIGENANPQECGVAIGQDGDGHLDGVAIGSQANGGVYGTAVGYSSNGNTRGVALGGTAEGDGQGVALGYYSQTNQKAASIAIGYRSKNSRQAELAMNIGDPVEADINKAYNQIVIGSWIRETTNATPTTMYVNGSATGRFTIRSQSSLTFKIMVTARDNTSGDCAAYLFDGLIKRDNANNTTLCVCNKTVLYNTDDASWDCDVAADDTNEALQITVTGDADNNVKWAARLDGVEVSWSSLQA